MGDLLPEISPSNLCGSELGQWFYLGTFGDSPEWTALNIDDGEPVAYRLLAVHEGVVYAELIGCMMLTALGEGSKLARWSRYVDGPPNLMIDGKAIYITHGRSLTAVDSSSGADIWQVNLPSRTNAKRPAVDGLQLIESTAVCVQTTAQFGKETLCFLTGSGQIILHSICGTNHVCVDIDNPLPEPILSDEPGDLVATDPDLQLAIIATRKSELTAVNAHTRQVIWHRQDSLLGASASGIVENGILLMRSERPDSSGLHAIDCASGQLLWSHPAITEEACAAGVVYVASSGVVHALGLHTGAEIWAEPVGNTEGATARPDDVSPIREMHVVGNILLVATHHTLTALRLPDG